MVTFTYRGPSQRDSSRSPPMSPANRFKTTHTTQTSRFMHERIIAPKLHQLYMQLHNNMHVAENELKASISLSSLHCIDCFHYSALYSFQILHVCTQTVTSLAMLNTMANNLNSVGSPMQSSTVNCKVLQHLIVLVAMQPSRTVV